MFSREIVSDKKVLDSIVLNFLGFQPFRYVLGKILYWLKFKITKNYYLEENNISLEVIKSGYTKKNNFLSQEEFEEIKNDYNRAVSEIKIKKENDNQNSVNHHIKLKIDEKNKGKYPALYKLKESSKIKNIFIGCELKRNIHINCMVEEIEVFDNTIHDDNREFHYDTFHNTFKAWLFLNNVTEKQGPLHIVPESHKFNIRRFFSEYWFSILYSLKIINQGSFRVDKKEKIKLNKESIKAEVLKNTLIVANTHNLHRRGDAENDTKRMAIHFWTREHPFKIFLKK